MNNKYLSTVAIAATILLPSCQGGNTEPEAEVFYKGADIGWYTQYEHEGKKFFNAAGEERECNALMKELGLNAVRHRVWVDPVAHGNWCSAQDLLKKCLDAKANGLEIMVDFHYSDWWADPGKQITPKAWKEHDLEKLKVDVANHTTEVMQLLKDNDIYPKWVQIGNETTPGMLWPIGRAKPDSCQNYAQLITAGYDALKKVFPNTIAIVHLDNGWKEELYDWNIGGIVANGGKFDMIGMSLYPYWAHQSDSTLTSEEVISRCIANVRRVGEMYNCPVMITEVGFEVDESRPEILDKGRRELEWVLRAAKDSTDGICKGVFYWEPECRPSQYRLGAFTEDGKPTVIMDAWKAVE